MLGTRRVVTVDSLVSLWVKKEFALPLVEAGADVDRVHAVVDSSDPPLVELIGEQHRPVHDPALEGLLSRTELRHSVNRRERLRRAEGFLESLDEFVERGGAIAFYPGEPARIPERLRVTTFETWAALVLGSGPVAER